MGVYVFSRRLLERVPPDEPYGLDELVRGLLQISSREATFQENLEGSSRSEAMSWQQMDVAKAREVLGWEAKISWPQTLHYMVYGKE
jgi:nucleoside-diphosphate-sugar epimerase